MDALRKYLVYGLKGLATVPLAFAGGHALTAYDQAVGETGWFEDPARRANVEFYAEGAMATTALFQALWSPKN